jgi:catechol 2,3-dioxygenase-like lactoylglutathione lyase family enzyme
MLANAKLQAFLLTTDPARSRAFYEGVLGLNFLSEDDFAITMKSGEVEIRLTRIEEHTPLPHTVIGWRVENIEAKVDELAAQGVFCRQYGVPGQDEKGIWTMADGKCKVCWFADPDGNVLSLAEEF